MLQFSANLSLLFCEVPLIERFAAAKYAGFNAVEIQFPYELSIEDIKNKLQVHDLKLVLINVPAADLMQGGDGLACVPDMQNAFKVAVSQAITYATALHVPCVNVLAGRQPSDASRADCEKTLIDNLHYAATQMATANIQTVFEAVNGEDMPRFYVQTVADMQHILTQVNHPNLAMQFDCYHVAMMQCGGIEGGVLTDLKENISNIRHIQFAGYPNRHEPTVGILDYTPIFTWLKQSAYTGYCGAEYRPLATTDEGLGWLNRV